MDATELLDSWRGRFDLGKTELDEVHLSTLGKYREDGFYLPQTVVELRH